MIRDITLGQYFPGNSLIHKIDARAKIVITLILIVAVFVASSGISFAFLFAVSLVIFIMSGISFKTLVKGLKPIVFILIFTTIFQIFFTRTGNLLFEWYFIKIYSNGIIFAVKMFIRIIVLITTTSVMLSYTTSPIVLTDGIEGLMMPLSKIGVPVHDFALVMSIALRFIPTLLEETEKIMSAQKARGTDFSTGSLMKRARALLAVFVPLLASAVRHAFELADAMICRGYRGGKGRTKLNRMKFRFSDFIWMLLIAAVLAGVIILNRYTFTVFGGTFVL
ncbi:MAG: energy-coupling factor transporter transmembrane protein EcfT [Clostridia bacterium]|nr:energy-coupling factor transporter transmembrane protein EcfT [Clostridia bacterium]